MGNYKPYGAILLSYGGITRPIDLNSDIKVLYYNHANSASPFSLFDTATGLVYTVTAGKKLTVYGTIMIHNAIAGLRLIHEGDTQDAITTLKHTIGHGAVASTVEYATQFEIASGKYVTVDPALANQLFFTTMIGIET